MGNLLQFRGRARSGNMATAKALVDNRDAAREDDREAVKVFLERRGSAISRYMAKATLTRLAKILGYEDEMDCPWSRLTYSDCQTIATRLRETCTPESVNTYITVMKGLARRAQRARLAKSVPDAWQGILDFEYLVSSPAAPSEGEMVSDAEYAALLATCDKTAADQPLQSLRDRCVIKMLMLTGLRVGTVVQLNRSSLIKRETIDKGVLNEQWSIRLKGSVRAKRAKEHVVPLAPDLVVTLKAYLAERGDWEGPLLVQIDAGVGVHRLKTKRLGEKGIEHILATRCALAGIPRRSPHKFRAAFITAIIDVAGLRAAQLLADHSDPKMTASYDKAGKRRMEDAILQREQAMNAVSKIGKAE